MSTVTSSNPSFKKALLTAAISALIVGLCYQCASFQREIGWLKTANESQRNDLIHIETYTRQVNRYIEECHQAHPPKECLALQNTILNAGPHDEIE